MKKKIIVSIPKPCHEGWEKMTPTASGRFCSSCQKQVIDFSNMSDEQIALHFRNKKGSTCGNFMIHQLNREMDLPKKRIPWMRYFFQFALPALLVSRSAAQNGQFKNIVGESTTFNSTESHKIKKGQPVKMDKQITGKIVDENGIGIPYASIFIKATTIAASTDSAGSFTIKYQNAAQNVILQCSSVGYESLEYEVQACATDQTIKMIMSGNTLGEVVIVSDTQTKRGFTTGVVVSRISVIETLLNKILQPKAEMTLYPNPVKANSMLTLRTASGRDGLHVFQLVTVTGQIVYKKELILNKSDKLVQLQIPDLIAGNYFLTMTDNKSAKPLTEKIIIINH